MKQLALWFLAASVPFALLNCMPSGDETAADEDGEEDIGVAQQGQGGNPATGGNHFHGHKVLAQDARDSYPLLAGAALNAGNGYLPSTINISSSNRVEALGDLVECALGVGQYLSDPLTGITFQGHFGLALSWMNGPATVAQQRWVTGCMIERLNAYGHEVPILLEGATSPIWWYSVDDNNYPWDESTAWGNLFSAVTNTIYVCSDNDLVNTCETQGKSINTWLQQRVCDGLVNCGMVYVGKCNQVCTYVTGSRGTYPQCTVNGSTYTETVHVQLPNAEATCTPVPLP